MKLNNDYINTSMVLQINDVINLCQLMKISLKDLYYIINNIDKYYNYYNIPKRNGDVRLICEPKPKLKYLQKYIQKNILENIPCSDFSMAYKKGVSIRDNAKYHINQKYILKMDLKDYFNNLKGSSVYNLFEKIGYDPNVSYILSHLCCLNGSLPQGAPTSPYLSNLLTYNLDIDLNNYCKSENRNLNYSRYSDDIVISGDFNAKEIIPEVIHIIRKHQLIVNYDKLVVIGQHKKQEVTGIVVNDKIQVSKSYRKKIRQEVYYIKTYGLEEHLKFNNIKYKYKEKYLSSLRGRINHCLQVNPDDVEMRRYKIFLKLF